MKIIRYYFQKIKNLIHLFEAVLANIIYNFPSRKIKVIGITGTDGKTTTTQLIAHILKNNKKKVSFISTVYASIGNHIYDTGLHVTTPSSFMINKFLSQVIKKNNDYFVLETTSHALDQNRVWGINYEVGVITNITHEHLDYHLNYYDYVKTKEKLIKMSKVCIINKKDQSFKFLSPQVKKKCLNYYESLKYLNYFKNLSKFNQLNYAAAYTVCRYLGLTNKQILNSMKTFKLPKGRLEIAYDKDFKIIIDFAHTPNAFANLLPEVRKMIKNNARLIHVFGSAGLRDASKRPLMGEESSKYADYIILTEEDYRTEKLQDICSQIALGIKNKPFEIIENRQLAINKAIKIAKKGDIVLITGKAHEKSLARGKIEHPWDEFQAVKKALKIKYKK